MYIFIIIQTEAIIKMVMNPALIYFSEMFMCMLAPIRAPYRAAIPHMTVMGHGISAFMTRPKKAVPVDVLVIREDGKLKVRISSIIFAANTANYLDVSEEEVEKNLRTLNRLAEIFQKYNRYNVRIEGHAVMVYWDDPERGKQEQEEVLLPLSTARANAVRDALIELGLDAGRLTAVGLGASHPIVPFNDFENRWKNRRVEFILIK